LSDFRRDLVALLPRLRRFAWLLVRNGQDSDDLLQRSVERALSSMHSWTPGSRLDLWVFRIMKNLWIDEVRSRGRWARIVEPLTDQADLGDHGASADAVLHSAELEKVRQAVEDLPEEQRIAVKLVLLGECSYVEAAEMLEIPLGTLTSRLARGRASLLRMFELEGSSH